MPQRPVRAIRKTGKTGKTGTDHHFCYTENVVCPLFTRYTTHAGVYADTIARAGGEWKFADRRLAFDGVLK